MELSVREGWVAALRKEENAFKDKGTYTEIEAKDLLPGDKPVPLVILLEEKEGGRQKARCIVLSNRCPAVEEKYAPVANWESVRLFLNNMVNEGQTCVSFDISEAFLHGELKERVVVRPPPQFESHGKFWVLNKAIYGLQQAPLMWNKKLHKSLTELGWARCKVDPCVYIQRGMRLVIYVDDGLIVGDDADINHERDQILKAFKGRKTDPVANDYGEKTIKFLGAKITIGESTVKISQEEIVEKVLKTFSMEDSHPVKTPLAKNLENHGDAADQKVYRSTVGSLMYLVTTSRPDLAFAVKELSRFLECPKASAMTEARRVLKYLKGTSHYGISFSKSSDAYLIEGYSDSDFAGEVPGRKSTTGNIVVVGGSSPIFWRSSTQRLTTLSTSEAELVALTDLAKEVRYARKLMRDIYPEKFVKAPSPIHCDNQSTIKIVAQDENLGRTKHLDIRGCFIRDNIRQKVLQLFYANTEVNLADFLTKPLSRAKILEVLTP